MTTTDTNADLVKDFLRRCQTQGLGRHPFFQREDRHDLRLVWAFMKHDPFTPNEEAFMNALMSNFDSGPIRRMLEAQFAAELGAGEHDTSHHVLHDQLVEGLARWASEAAVAAMVGPTEQTAEGFGRLFGSENGYEGLGAYLAGEVTFGTHLAPFVGRTMTAHEQELDARTMAWVKEHDEVEDDHVQEALGCLDAVALSDADVEALIRGGEGMLELLWGYVDALHAIDLEG